MVDKNNFKDKFDEVCSFLNIDYCNLDLYFEAFTHPSYANEINSNKDYERLEFLGDAILDFLVGEFLFNSSKNFKEGDMTKIKATYVCENANADYTMEMHLNTLIMVGVGAYKSKEYEKKSVLGNIFESFLGALYLDHDIDYVRHLLEKWVFPKIADLKMKFFIDYKTKLQEAMQAERGESPTYLIVNETGPSHDKTFEALVKIDNIKLGRGIGKTKKDAEQNAAKAALEILAKN